MSVALAAQPQPESMERTDAGFVLSWLEILQGCAGPGDVPPALGGWCLRQLRDWGKMDRHTLQIWWFPTPLSEVFGLRLFFVVLFLSLAGSSSELCMFCYSNSRRKYMHFQWLFSNGTVCRLLQRNSVRF